MKQLHGYESEYIRIIDFSHYDKNERQNMWTAECKTCGKHFLVKSGSVERRKSCGCSNGKGIHRPLSLESLHENMPNILTQRWLKNKHIV